MRGRGHIAVRLLRLLVLTAPAAVSNASAANVLAIEGETLVAKAKASVGKVSAQPMAQTGWSGNSHLLWTGGVAGAVLELVIDVPAPAQYAVEVYFTRAPDYAQVAMEIDGNPLSVAFNGYAPRPAAPAPTQAGKLGLQAGAHTLRLKITGKASQSSGYLVGLDLVKLYPAGALAGREAAASRPRSQSAPGKGSGGNPPQPTGKGEGGGAPPQQSKGPDAECPSTCALNVSSVYRKTDSDQCRLWFRVPCNPYNCDKANGVCRDWCQTNADCAQGAHCNTSTNMCADYGVRCKDGNALLLSNGFEISCAPGKCRGDACVP